MPLRGARARAGRRQVPYIQVEPHTKSHAFHLALTAVIGLASFQAGARPRDPVGPVGSQVCQGTLRRRVTDCRRPRRKSRDAHQTRVEPRRGSAAPARSACPGPLP